MSQASPRRRALRCASRFALVLVGILGPATAGKLGTPAGAAPGELILVAAPLTIAPDDLLAFDITVPTGTRPPASLEVSARLIDLSATELDEALRDSTSPPDDSVVIDPTSITTADGVLHFAVPTETGDEDPTQLSLVEAGTYVIKVQAQNVGGITLPIIRRDESTAAPEVPLGFVVDIDSPLSLQPDGSTSITSDSRTAIARLATFLEVAPVPVAVSIRPELLDSLKQSSLPSDGQLVDRLRTATGRHRILSVPYLHLDPSVAANAGAEADFIEQLRIGEDALNRRLGRLPDRRVWLATEPLSPLGAKLVRDLGAQVLVEAAGVARDLKKGALQTDSKLRSIIVPRSVDEAMSRVDGDPVRTAHRFAVELLLAAVGGEGANGLGRPIVIAPNLRTVNLDVLSALSEVTANNDSLRAVDMVSIGSGLDQAVSDSAPVVADFSASQARREKLGQLVEATASILPGTDQRRVEWAIRAGLLLDTRLADDERAAYETQLRADLLEIQNNIVLLLARTVNLSDRDADIPVTIENRNDVAVSVSVRLVSSRLRVPPSSEVVTLEPGATATVRIPVSARSNGRFPVRAQLLALDSTTVIGKSAFVNVRVGRLTGLGIVATFAAALALLSWWVQHLRRKLRREETKELERRKLAGLPVDDFDDVIVVDADPPQPGDWGDPADDEPHPGRP